MQQALIPQPTPETLGEQIYVNIVEPLLKRNSELLRLMAADGKSRVRILEFEDVDDAYLLWCYVSCRHVEYIDVDVRMATVCHVYNGQYAAF